MKFSIEDFFSKRDQIRRKLQIWSHLLKKYLMENLIFCAVRVTGMFSIYMVLHILSTKYFAETFKAFFTLKFPSNTDTNSLVNFQSLV